MENVSNEDRIKASVVLNKVWGSVDEIEKNEKEFMEAIRSILWRLSADPDMDDHGYSDMMNSSYDADTALEDIKKLISEYNKIYHIVHTSLSWRDDKFSRDTSQVEN